jgi:hypothetical protein
MLNRRRYLLLVCGLINRFIGGAWGYRSCIMYRVILAGGLFLLRRTLNRFTIKGKPDYV